MKLSSCKPMVEYRVDVYQCCEKLTERCESFTTVYNPGRFIHE